MKKLMIIAALAALAGGCRTVTVENRGDGKGYKVTVMSNMMKSELDSMKASISPGGVVEWEMGRLNSSPSEEFAKSLMTLTYIARIAASMYSPAAAAVPLTDEAADAEQIAALVKANAEAKAELAKAKAEAAAHKAQGSGVSSQGSDCKDGSCKDGSCND